MGILDEAIREHLELKRQHGAEESELKGLESEAFGPADRPDATEAQTEVISPGSSLTTPAGEGDQLDKVFEATRMAEAEAASGTEEDTVVEHKVPEPTAEPAPAPSGADESDEPKVPEASAAAPVEQSEIEAETEAYEDIDGGDAGDALQRERLTLSDHPTEHYDVDAAIAEEDEIDVLSESSLSDELDRALDGPLEEEPVAAAPAAPAEPAEPDLADDPLSDEFDAVFDDEPEGEAVEPETGEEDLEPETGEEDEPEQAGDPNFFDQEDPLEATPDFLEETPEHDRLWFEQKPPKDFEFGD
ncbi:MAG TPA: hypothetical protein VMF31_13130 [Solirubrobacterales bacterium]|nr:hypothetical protein [Solirubrobacterales bacterium]